MKSCDLRGEEELQEFLFIFVSDLRKPYFT